MTLYLIGLGLGDQKDISLKGLEIIKRCSRVYLENYTSLLQCPISSLEKLYGKKITLAARETCEQGAEKIVEEAKRTGVAFLVVGDPFSATTHVELYRLAKEKKVPVQVINNVSILTAVGITGLQLYRFGKTASIPFLQDVPQIETPYMILRENRILEMHTLFLLDLKPQQKTFLTIREGLEILESIEARKKEGVVKESILTIGCARLGSDTSKIVSAPLKKLKSIDFGQPPYCFIIPGKLHFLEEEMVEMWKAGP